MPELFSQWPITSEMQYQNQCIIHCLAKEFPQTRVEAINHWSPLVVPELENNDMEAAWLDSLFFPFAIFICVP